MNTEQFFSREITLNKSFDETFNYVLQVGKMKGFSPISETKTLSKILIKFSINDKIEILIERVSEEQTKVRILILDRNDNYHKVSDVASNISLNFENALTAVIEGKSDEFKIQPLKIDGAQGCVQIIIFIVVAASLAYAIYTMFFKN